MQMTLICDNQTTLHVTSNHVFYEMTKHIEIGYYFIRENILSRDIANSCISSFMEKEIYIIHLIS